MTGKEFVRQFFLPAEIHAHGREIWIFSCSYEEYKAAGYDHAMRKVISKGRFVYEGSWDDVKEEKVWEEACQPVWDSAAEWVRENIPQECI